MAAQTFSGSAACRGLAKASRSTSTRAPAPLAPGFGPRAAPSRVGVRDVTVAERRADSPILAPMIQTGPESFSDLKSYLLQDRIIFLGSRVTDDVANNVCATLLALEAADPDADIKMYINSAGGLPHALVAVLDVMEHVKCDIQTVAFGCCISQSTLILAAGTKGKRYSMPSTRLMIHTPQGGAMGSADEVNIQTKELNRTMQVFNAFYQKFTGLDLDTIQMECDRDNFMTPARAQELGLIDAVIECKNP